MHSESRNEKFVIISDNTSKYFTYMDFTYKINKCDITYMLLSTVISKVIYK